MKKFLKAWQQLIDKHNSTLDDEMPVGDPIQDHINALNKEFKQRKMVKI